MKNLGAKNVDFIGNYVGDRVYFEMSPEVFKKHYNNIINGVNIFVDGEVNLEEAMANKTSQLRSLKESLGATKYNKIQSLIKECLNEGMEVEITIPKKKCKKNN